MPRAATGATRTYEIERMAFLSDGIIAIAITLLVLDLKPAEPPPPGTHLFEGLGDNVPDFLAWFVSFVVILRLWLVQHHVVARLERCRAGTIVINFAFLGSVSLLPFGASLLGAYHFDNTIAVVVFSALLGLAGFLLGLFITRTRDEPRIDDLPDPDGERLGRYHLLGVPVVALAAAVAGYYVPLVAMAMWFAESIALVAVLAARRDLVLDEALDAT